VETYHQRFLSCFRKVRNWRAILFPLQPFVDLGGGVEKNGEQCEIVSRFNNDLELLLEGFDLLLVIEELHKRGESLVCSPIHEEQSACLVSNLTKDGGGSKKHVNRQPRLQPLLHRSVITI
jgi:hypothetical protein